MKFLTTALNDVPWIEHGFFTRVGGEGTGIYASLNCAWSAKEDAETVRANRGKIAEALQLAPGALVTLSQHHSPDVVIADKPWTREETPKGDALVTTTAGLGIGVLTADCAPVLFASRKDKIIGAAHAGWKGAFGGVIESTVEAMKVKGALAQDIVAAIGPCIGPQSYEVSEDFKIPFMEQDKANAKFFRKAEKPGHLIFDLPGYVAQRIAAAGIGTVYDTARDTLSDEATFFSYRRSCLKGEADYGRQISAIAIIPA